MCQGQGGMGAMPSGMPSGMPRGQFGNRAPAMIPRGMQRPGMPQTGGAMSYNQPAPSMNPYGNFPAGTGGYDPMPETGGGMTVPPPMPTRGPISPWNPASGLPNGPTGPGGGGFRSPGAPDIPNPWATPETGGNNFVNETGPSMLPPGFGGPNVSGQGMDPRVSPQGLSQGSPWGGGNPMGPTNVPGTGGYDPMPGAQFGNPKFDPMSQAKAERQFRGAGGLLDVMPQTGGANFVQEELVNPNRPGPTGPGGGPNIPNPNRPNPTTPNPTTPGNPYRPTGNVRQWDGYGALDDLQGDGALEFTYDPTRRGGVGSPGGPGLFSAERLHGRRGTSNMGNMFMTDSTGRRIADAMGHNNGTQMTDVQMTPGQRYFLNYSGFTQPMRVAGMY